MDSLVIERENPQHEFLKGKNLEKRACPDIDRAAYQWDRKNRNSLKKKKLRKSRELTSTFAERIF